jgi:hypothetical protein
VLKTRTRKTTTQKTPMPEMANIACGPIAYQRMPAIPDENNAKILAKLL